MKTSSPTPLDVVGLKPSLGKTRWYAYGLLGVLCAGSLISIEIGGTRPQAYLLLVITIGYALFLPVWLGIREGFQSAKSELAQLSPSQGVLSYIPVSHMAQAGQFAAIFGLSLLAGFATFTVDSDIGPFCSVIFLTGPVLLPFWIAEMFLVRRWGRTPEEAIFRSVMASASAAGFVFGFVAILLVGGLAPQNDTSWNYVPLFLTPTLYVYYALRYRSVKRWLALVKNESERADTAVQARQIAEMQLTLLQAQIEPHFLYNTLASIQYLVRNNPLEADFLLSQLIRYLRQAMPKMRATMSTLGQEFELVDAYLQIARMRMGGRLAVEVELAESLHQHPFPPLIVQTLVENALKHGVEPKVGQVSVKVTASLEGDLLTIGVKDTGVGLGRAAIRGGGTGLANIRDRLAGIYPRRAHLNVVDLVEGGVESTVTVNLATDGI